MEVTDLFGVGSGLFHCLSGAEFLLCGHGFFFASDGIVQANLKLLHHVFIVSAERDFLLISFLGEDQPPE